MSPESFEVPWEAVVALLGIIVVSLPQLTARARLSRRVTFWTAQVQGSKPGYEQDIADSLRRDAVARLLALEAYPAWLFLIPWNFAVCGVYICLYTGYKLGSAEFTVELGVSILCYLLLAMTGMGLIARWTLGVIRGRQLLTEQYLRADVIRTENILDIVGSRKVLSRRQHAGCMVGGGGLAMLLCGGAALASVPNPSDAFLVGSLFCLIGFGGIVAWGFHLTDLALIRLKLVPGYPRAKIRKARGAETTYRV